MPDWITNLNWPYWQVALLGCLASANATGLGALPVLLTEKISDKLQAILLGFGAGVMLAATCFSLLVPAIDSLHARNILQMQAAGIICAGMAIGYLFIFLCDRYAPHEHFLKGYEGLQLRNMSRVWLFIIAITIHNFPEGLAVGVGFGSGDLTEAIPLAIGIGLQNIPEGLVVALALLAERYPKWQAIAIAATTGIVEPIGSLIGYLAVSFVAALLPWGLSFAAGAMLYVISHEIIPESHRKGFDSEATFGLMVGFFLMLFLDVGLN